MSDRGRPASAALYDALAGEYDEHFAVPHRRAYDDLAWERVAALLPQQPATVVDVGCGVGRWADRLVALGHRVIGIEGAPAMAAAARTRADVLGTNCFTVIEARMEDDRPELTGHADAVIAMGSFQYADDPDHVLASMYSWLRPDGVVAILVDSLGGLVATLLHEGRAEEAIERAATRRGHWEPTGPPGADLALYDRRDLTERLQRAGFRDVDAHGLLVSASILGVAAFTARLAQDPAGTLATERSLAEPGALADLGKQLLVTGRRCA